MDNAKQDQGAASEGTSESPCSAGWEWRPRDLALWPLVNWVRRMIGKPAIGDIVYAIHFAQPITLQPGESMTVNISLPNASNEGRKHAPERSA